MKIAVLGAGAWGTALAVSPRAAPRRRCCGRAMRRRPRRCRASAATRATCPTSRCRRRCAVTGDHAAALRHAAGGLAGHRHADGRRCARCLAALPQHCPALWLCKGFEAGTGALGHEIAHAIAGPQRLRPCCRAPASRWRSRAASRPRWWPRQRRGPARRSGGRFPREALRVYATADLIGVEIGGAVKNVLAIATGLCDGAGRCRAERARRADHARPGGDDAARRGAGRPRRNLHGPVGAGRPGAHRHRRPVAQPPRRAACWPPASRLPQILAASAMSPKACTRAPTVVRACAVAAASRCRSPTRCGGAGRRLAVQACGS